MERGAKRRTCLSEASCAPSPRSARIAGDRRAQPDGSRPGCAFFWLLFFAQAKKSDSRLRSRSESLCFQALASAAFSKEKKFQLQEQELSLSFGERVTSLCLCKEKVTKRKHTLPPRPTRYARRVHSAAGIFRRDIPVSSKNDVLARFAVESGAVAARRLPVRRGEAVLRLFPPNPCTSPLRGLVRRLRRCGREPGKARSRATATATATATANCALPVEQEEGPLSRPFLVCISGACITPCAVQPTGGTRTTPAPPRQR